MNNIIPQRLDTETGSMIHSPTHSYRIEQKIGEGGFGIVLKVKEGATDYALKLTKMWEFMPNEQLEYARRFRQEYEYSKELDSKYLVRSHDFALAKGNPFMTMDYCENGCLRDLFDRPPDYAEINRIAIGILKGLASLHEQGIVHRDIKPENVLFDAQHQPKLADFGISSSVKKRHTQANVLGHAKAVFATCVYSPPEQMDFRRAMKVMGNTNDIYAFGATMYEWLTCGCFPFGTFEDFSNDMVNYERKRRNNDWDRKTLGQSIGDSLWVEIVGRCLRYNPQNRFQHCADIISLILKTEYNRSPSKPEFNISADTIWALQVKNGDEIGRIFNLTTLAKNYRLPSLAMGWLNPKDPFINQIGLTEEFTQYISERHATLEHDSGRNYWYIRDGQQRIKDGVKSWQASTNGVLLNSRFIDKAPQRLNPGDIIMIGDTSLKVMIL